PMKAAKFKDKHLSCTELRSELLDASFKNDMYHKRAELPELYAGSVSCFASTSMQLTRAAKAAEDREKYLSMLYEEKGCNMPKNIIPKAPSITQGK
ncbi:MAG: hypothetical protein ACK5V4_05405, partial [Alphaproteobacteria bacterium]